MILIYKFSSYRFSFSIYKFKKKPNHAISIDGDSDSLSEFRDISPMKSPMIDETATNMSYKVNGFAYTTHTHGNQSSANGRSNGVKKSHSKESNDGHYDRKENPHHQTNGSTELSNGIHSSPLRSQLGLNLKSSTTPVKKPINFMTVSSFTFHNMCHRKKKEYLFQLFLYSISVSIMSIFIRQCNNFRGTHKSNAF